MAEFSSTINEEKTNNRSDPSRIYNIGQMPLAQLRPEKLDDMALKKQITIIQEVCEDIDPDLIAVIFHECDYNIQNTIARIKRGDYEDGGWQTAKPNNKKKNHSNHLNDQISNGNTQSDSERSHSQRTSPTSSLRGGTSGGGRRRRQDQYQKTSSPRTNTTRQNDSGRNLNIPSNLHSSSGDNSTNTNPITNNEIEISSSSKQNDEITPKTSSSTDEYEFIDGTSQSLTFNNSLKKPLSLYSKRPIPSSIPREPVSMHRTIQYSSKPIDIQFGDIQWNDSIPITLTPSNSPILNKSLDEQDSSSNLQTTNDIDRKLTETIDRLSSISITTNPIINNSSEETSHLSEQITNSSQEPIQITSSTSNTSEYTSPISQTNNSFLSNTVHNSTNSSAFTPFQSIPRDYSPTTLNWNQQSSINYKSNSKSNLIQTGNYPQQTSYQIPTQQQFFLGTYSYPTQTLYPVITSVDPWSTPGFESYSTYSTANYLPTYPTQQQYHSNTKYDQYIYDKDFFANYGQTRLSNTDLSNTSQPTKDITSTSKLSATAASFSQATSPAPTFYFNPVVYTTVPTYYPSHQDRTMTYSSIDNRNGASYTTSGNHNRNNYHQQQRTYNNSTWHSQQ